MSMNAHYVAPPTILTMRVFCHANAVTRYAGSAGTKLRTLTPPCVQTAEK